MRFFLPEDFIDCDHLIEGEFDAEGNFQSGKTQVSDEYIENHLAH